MKELWDKVKNEPEEFKDKRVSYMLEEMREEAIENVVKGFSDMWCVPDSAVLYAAQRMKRDSEEIPGLNNIKDQAYYAAYKEKNGSLPKFKYNQAMKKDLRRKKFHMVHDLCHFCHLIETKTRICYTE